MIRSFATVVVGLACAMAAPAQDWAKVKLAKSPRHGEGVKVKHGTQEVQSFVVYPEVKEKATAVKRIKDVLKKI